MKATDISLAALIALAGCRTQPLEPRVTPGSGAAPDLAPRRMNDLAFTPGPLDASIVFDLPPHDLQPGDEVNLPRPPAPLYCAGNVCYAQFCCVAADGTQSCAPTCSSQEIAFACDNPYVCSRSPNGPICCLESGARGTTCATSCNGLQLCKSTSDCPNGTTCRRVAGLPDDSGACLAPD